MNNKKMRRVSKPRSKPAGEEKMIALKSRKRLISEKANAAKEARAAAILTRIFGGAGLILTFSLWQSKYSVIPMSILAILVGVILAGLFKLAYPNGWDESNKIPKKLVVSFMVIMMLLIVIRSIAGYAIMLMSGFWSAVFLFGVIKTLPSLKA